MNRRATLKNTFWFSLCIVFLFHGESLSAPSEIRIRLTAQGEIEVTGIDSVKLPRGVTKWNKCLTVHVGNSDRPAIAGQYRLDKGSLFFTPRFPFVPGVAYEAIFRCREPELLIANFTIRKPVQTSTTNVSQVFPTADRLPENLLKFYLHFSAPMSKGEAYRHIHLIDENGKEVQLPFLELDEELWDFKGARFTLFFDPGRIKRGLKPREDLGPALEEGKRYSLLVDRDWPDARGVPLKESFRKNFAVLAPDDKPIDPHSWRIQAPGAGTLQPLKVCFPKSLDSALLEHVLSVVDDKGKQVAGTPGLDNHEALWKWTPRAPWESGRYQLVVDGSLEDLSGNQIGRPFEVDVFQSVDRQEKRREVRLPFSVSK
jgi:hypothetical protein